jgi:hypothetical protein
VTALNENAPDADGPATVVRAFLAAGPERLIRTAVAADLRAVAGEVTGSMCRVLRRDLDAFTAYGGPGGRRLGAVCQAGKAMRAGFELQDAVMKAVAGDYLAVAGFSPAIAAASPDYHTTEILPVLAGAGRPRMRVMLAGVITRIRAVTDDFAAARTLLAAVAPDAAAQGLDMEAACETAAVSLYGYVALAESARVLHAVVTGLGGTIPALTIGEPLAPDDLAHPN